MNRLWVLASLGAALAIPIALFCCAHSSPAQDKKDPPPGTLKWEYKKVGEVSEKELGDLGAHGWELCGVVSKTSGSVRTDSNNRIDGAVGTGVYFIFKRPKA